MGASLESFNNERATASTNKTSSTESRCDKCKNETVIKLAYGPHNFCEKHFTRFFENRFKKTIRKYKLLKSKEKILVALSGGKDSVILLHLLHKFYNKSNTIEALIIDEGVKNYRDKSVKVAVKNCEERDIKYKVVSFASEFDVTNDEIMPLILKNDKLGGTCAYCGTMRRTLMNKYAKEMGADKLATGHNMDDETQSFIMNVFNNDFKRLKRTGANAGVVEHEGFVKRIKPLYETPEKEIIAYCIYNEIEHYSEVCCPYSWTAKRNEFREMLNNFENRFPGTQFSIMRFNEQLKENLEPSEKQKKELKNQMKKCKKCGEPTDKEYCKTCEMIVTLKNEKKKQTKTKKRNVEKYNTKLTCHSTKYGE
jgi:uncharacterized protein (TIGR00269 family)